MNKKRGFTLIELLVVVLIIGILAAVALPQYTQAVEKSRIGQVVSLLKTIKEAEEVYYMSNGEYTSDASALDISWKCPDGWTCTLLPDGDAKIQASRPGVDIIYSFAYRSYAGLANILYCSANTSSEKSVRLCKSMGPELVSDGTYKRYRIQ